MTPVDDIGTGPAATQDPRRVWKTPAARRLATSEAENSTGLGPDAETVAS